MVFNRTIVLYYMIFILKQINVSILKVCGQRFALFFITTLLSIVFVTNIFMKHLIGIEIREVIFPDFRITTNRSCFCLGVWYSVNENEVGKYRNCFKYIVLFSFVAVCTIFYYLDILWASSLYDFSFVVAGTICILRIRINKEITNKVILNLSDKSIGIWYYIHM